MVRSGSEIKLLTRICLPHYDVRMKASPAYSEDNLRWTSKLWFIPVQQLILILTAYCLCISDGRHNLQNLNIINILFMLLFEPYLIFFLLL